jgi:hypothetical protein
MKISRAASLHLSRIPARVALSALAALEVVAHDVEISHVAALLSALAPVPLAGQILLKYARSPVSLCETNLKKKRSFVRRGRG